MPAVHNLGDKEETNCRLIRLRAL